MNIKQAIKNKRLYFDGGAGTLLQTMGLKGGERAETWNITNPEKIIKMHKDYLLAGADILTTNTFGASVEKFPNYEEIIVSAINCAKKAVEGFKDKYIAFDVGPSGRLLKPLGDFEFEDAVE